MPKVILADGTVVQFSPQQGEGDFEAQGVGAKVTASLADVSDVGGRLMSETITNVRSALSAVAPDELEIEIGLAVSYEGTVIVTSGKAEANVSITAKWKLTHGKVAE
jgi:hypothetical protein